MEAGEGRVTDHRRGGQGILIVGSVFLGTCLHSFQDLSQFRLLSLRQFVGVYNFLEDDTIMIILDSHIQIRGLSFG